MQLTLPVHLPVEQQFESFIVGCNTQLVERMKALVFNFNQITSSSHMLSPRQLFIHGTRGQGKSHLLYSMCHLAETHGVQSFYLDLNQASRLPVSLLEGLNQTSLLCFDDIDKLVGNSPWQVAIFDLINQRTEQGTGGILFTSSIPMTNTLITSNQEWLPDLLSRLSWGETYAIKPLGQSDQIKLLNQRADQKGLKFSEQAMMFILNHCERSTKTLIDIIERLDRRSMTEKKPLTINMIKRELDL